MIGTKIKIIVLLLVSAIVVTAEGAKAAEITIIQSKEYIVAFEKFENPDADIKIGRKALGVYVTKTKEVVSLTCGFYRLLQYDPNTKSIIHFEFFEVTATNIHLTVK